MESNQPGHCSKHAAKHVREHRPPLSQRQFLGCPRTRNACRQLCGNFRASVPHRCDTESDFYERVLRSVPEWTSKAGRHRAILARGERRDRWNWIRFDSVAQKRSNVQLELAGNVEKYFDYRLTGCCFSMFILKYLHILVRGVLIEIISRVHLKGCVLYYRHSNYRHWTISL